MSLKHIDNKHCQQFIPSCSNQMFLHPGLLLWEMGGQVGILGAGVNWRLASFGIAQSCTFVRSQTASLTADLEPRHQKVKAQLLCGCCCSVSHGVGRDDPVDPVYPLESSPSARLAAVLYHIRSVWSKAQEQDQELSCQSEELLLYLVMGTWE